MSSDRVAVIVHQSDTHLGRLKPALEDLSLDLVEIDATADALADLDDARLGGVISLGGEMGAIDEDAYPYLVREIALLRDAHEDGIPVLGICLGGQLLARALGAPVRAQHRHEVGWLDVEVLTADPLLGEPGLTPQFQWHHDSFEVPAGAEHVARSPACPGQVFRAGASYGIQFHPEVDVELLRRWSSTEGGRADLARHGQDPDALLARAEELDDLYERQARRIAAGFAELVRARRAAPPGVVRATSPALRD
jgi:GMP synthase (glutamine-hydrolysing)